MRDRLTSDPFRKDPSAGRVDSPNKSVLKSQKLVCCFDGSAGHPRSMKNGGGHAEHFSGLPSRKAGNALEVVFAD